MQDVILHNYIIPIYKKISEVLDSYPQKKIVWFGSDDFVAIMNTRLLRENKHISMVVDNNSAKWGQEVLNVYPMKSDDYYSLKEKAPKIFIQSPDILRELKEDVLVFVASRFNDEILKQLEELGIDNDKIYAFSVKKEDCIMQEPAVRKLIAGKKMLSLKEMQQREFDILKYFRDFCNRHGLRYFLVAGTLLGAVRHKGFIPWDDDVDVGMPYEDYNRFLAIYENEKEKYKLFDWKRNPDYMDSFARLIDTKTLLLYEAFPIQLEMGVWLDVFPWSGYPEKKEEIEKKWDENIAFNQRWKEYYFARDILPEIEDPREEIIKKKYEEYPFSKSKMVGGMHTPKRYRTWATKAEYCSDTTIVYFEGEPFNAPIGYDGYLTDQYGNYMELPDVNNRFGHLFPAYAIE